MTTPTPSRTQAERSDLARARILEAALREFAEKGLAGARTDQIAAQAGVNKALIYYYFESKEKLYSAVLEKATGTVRDSSMALFLSGTSPGERILRSALAHFDRILGQQAFQRLLQQEMMRIHKGESGMLDVITKRVFSPLIAIYQATVREGIAAGELIDVDWMQIHLSSLGANVFYFLSAAVWRGTLDADPYSPEALSVRRQTLVRFMGQAIFVDRAHGAEVAERVLADTPMPDIENSLDFYLGRKDEPAQ
jgi:TetR/AcrR family transcriptional regulator